MKINNSFQGLLKAFFSITKNVIHKVRYKICTLVRLMKYFQSFAFGRAKCAYFSCRAFLSTFVALLSLFVNLSSCSYRTTDTSISNKSEAFNKYNAFSDSVADNNKIAFEELPQLLCRWKVLEDTLLYFLDKDTLGAHGNVSDIISCAEIGNRIHHLVDHAVDDYKCDYKDLVILQHNFPTMHLNKKMLHLQQDADIFFQGMDSAFISSVDSKSAFRNYKAMLLRWQKQEFNNHDILRAFLKEEDYHYRSFLAHLYEYSSQDAATIIQGTEILLSRIFSDADRYSLDGDEVIVFMSVRVNRRLIQNTDVCLSNLTYSPVQNQRQAAMAVSMLLNPYTNFNQLTLGMRTPGQYAQLMDRGEKISLAINSIQGRQFMSDADFDNLPNKLIKEYVAFVMNQ